MSNQAIRFIDLFCGIGGFHIAINNACARFGRKAECVFASDIDADCQSSYKVNFSIEPHGDITKIDAKYIPDHDILLAGFPCQPFSIIGQRRGFEDTRGTLFFDIARIIENKKPSAFVLENVKLLSGHNKGKTLQRILNVLNTLGYTVHYKILNALSFGLPQKRERIFIVGSKDTDFNFKWPDIITERKSLDDILEKNVPDEYYASDYISKKRKSVGIVTKETTIWHENKAGHISAYPYSCALRAGASYNYLLVNGERRLTSREMFRLQGFPDSYKIVGNYSQSRKQAGNSLPIPMAQKVIEALILQSDLLQKAIQINLKYEVINDNIITGQQLRLLERKKHYGRPKNKKC